MTTNRFTRDQVLAEAKKRYDKPIFMNALDVAMQEDTFEDAVELLICETQYADGTWAKRND